MLGMEETQVELGVCQEDENSVGNAEKARWYAWRGLRARQTEEVLCIAQGPRAGLGRNI